MEIATSVGGALLAPAFESLFNHLASRDLLQFARKNHLITELQKWKEMLEGIYGVLEDAEEKQMMSRSVEIWVTQLRDLAYDVEDILDEFDFEARQSKLKAQGSKVRKLFGKMNLKAVKFNSETTSKIKGITTRLEQISLQKNHLELREIAIESRKREEKRATSCLVNKAEIFGREEDKNEILQLLKSYSSSGRFSVIGIVGMGGVGKTTLAQLIFDEVANEFDLSIWVSVGEDFSIVRLTKAVVQAVGGDFSANDLNPLQLSLKEKLLEKKFFIVLDDVWNEHYEDWTIFRRPFENGALGSKIMVTTRHYSVAQMMGVVQSYSLNQLRDDDCVSVLAQHAFGVPNFEEHKDLEDIGKMIVERCRGLPLAAKALGGLLQGQLCPAAWEKVLFSGIWEEKSGILPALRLSYYYLPSHLKRCFAYCAIFPKDYKFHQDVLVLQWMAEGFLQHSYQSSSLSGDKTLLGRDYFQELRSRCFFQQSTSDKSSFVMHDLINDLARSISKEICINLDDKLEPLQSYAKVRHSAFAMKEYEIHQRFATFDKMVNLRTFLPLPIFLGPFYYVANDVMHGLVPKLKRLRVLSLAGYRLTELPSSIAFLKHLRYFDLSHTCIKRLPRSLSNLLNLETLMLSDCWMLIELPSGIGNLTKLMHLNLESTHALQEMPLEVAYLTNLQTLSKFIVGEWEDNLGISELANFPHLVGKLSIEGLENVTSIQDAVLANLDKIDGLDELALVWSPMNLVDEDQDYEFQVLNSLKPHKKLGKLMIEFYGGKRFPPWIGDPAFTELEDLELCHCKYITSLPPLGSLPKLKKLCIQGLDKVLEVGMEFYGENSSSFELFPSLEMLEIVDMSGLKQWTHPDNVSEFPKLYELTISNCLDLVGTLPTCLPSLMKLHIVGCQASVLKNVPHLSSLTTLVIVNIPGLESLDEVVTQSLVALKELEIGFCEQMVCLLQVSTDLYKLSSLACLDIKFCRNLVSLVGGEEGFLPQNLETLSIFRCVELRNLPNGLHSLTSLRELRINSCPKLLSFPASGLPSSLKHINIIDCDSLEYLPKGIVHDSNGRNEILHLESFIFSFCPSLTLHQFGEFPSSIKYLNFCCWSAQLLESFRKFSNLTLLEIDDCKLESLPENGLAIPNLTSLTISRCENLRSLPNQIHNLFSLQHLAIKHCGGLVSFPDEGLPPNLGQLEIEHCKNLKQPMLEWRLSTLTCLTRFSIIGTSPSIEMASFPDEEGLLLPSSLTFLQIEQLKNLKSISRGILHLTSLCVFRIAGCPKIKLFPREGLPATLGYLCILDCPLLEKRCRKEKGQYWHFIANIPRIQTAREEIEILPWFDLQKTQSRGNNLLQKCKVRLHTINPKWFDSSLDPCITGASCTRKAFL